MLHYQPSTRRALLIPLVPALFLLPLSIDFKGLEGGSAWQYTLVAVTLLGWAFYFASNGLLKARGRLWKRCHRAILLCLGGSLVSLAVNGTAFDQYARVILPIALFGLAFFFGARMTHTTRLVTLNGLIRLGCVVSVLFSIGAGLVNSGRDISEIRYQILSPVLLMFEAMLLHDILIAKRHVMKNTMWLVACVALQLVSVTRSSILGFGIIFLAALWLSSPTILRFVRRTVKISVPSGVAIALAVFASAAVSPEVLDRWQTRVFAAEEHGVDPTSLSRLAEIKEQLNRWSESPVSMLFGKGYGASYGWSKDLWDALIDTQAFGLDGVDLEYTVFGHNYWVSSLFSGGILFGLALPLALIYATYYGVMTSRRLLRSRFDEGTRLEISRTTLMLIATLAMTIGGNPFSYRYGPLILGAALGSMVVLLRRSEQRYAAQTGLHPGLVYRGHG